ncbi:MAG: hypothetical protein CVT95_08390 [Bacteroidetes bacterium HGW-Bacteroidetes-12]|nr:MAG: hypothetical protein CVT95_08390 [Bacteroidetes bacterium HGW-Bacteroidetes-12]
MVMCFFIKKFLLFSKIIHFIVTVRVDMKNQTKYATKTQNHKETQRNLVKLSVFLSLWQKLPTYPNSNHFILEWITYS